MTVTPPAPAGHDPERYLRESVIIEPLALQEEYVRLPADLAFWNAQAADANRRLLLAKLDLDFTGARLNLEKRSEAEAVGKKTTEAGVAAAVELDPDYHAARLRVVEAEAEYARLRGVCEAVRAKKDMLVSIGADNRAEMAGDLVLREQRRGNRLTGEG